MGAAHWGCRVGLGLAPAQQSAPPGHVKPNPGFYRCDDVIEFIVRDGVIACEHDMTAILEGKRGAWLHLISDHLRHTHVIENGFKIAMKITAQFVGLENIENGVVGSRSGQIEQTRP
jgi:hypothetical protein